MAQEMVSYIYLKYLANSEEKHYFKLKEQKEEIEEKKALEESLNSMFNKRKKEIVEEKNENTSNLPVVIKKEGLFKRLIKKIKLFLLKRNGD